MAKKDEASLDQKQKKELQRQLKQLGLDGRFLDLIHDAIINDWSPNQFVTRLVRDDRFRSQFPGLFQGGDLNPFLVGQENAPLSAETLRTAITGYNRIWETYERVGKRFGYGKLTKQQVGALIGGEISPDEFGKRAYAVQQVKKNPELFDFIKQQANLAGEKLQQKDLFRFAAGAGDQKFYDIYEAARLQAIGLGLSAADTRQVAKSLTATNAEGVPTSGIVDDKKLADLVATVRARQADIGPELQQAGISALDLSKWVASNGTSDPSLSLKLETLVASKRSRGAYVAGTQVRGGPGGAAQYEEQGAASYG